MNEKIEQIVRIIGKGVLTGAMTGVGLELSKDAYKYVKGALGLNDQKPKAENEKPDVFISP